LHWSFLKSAHSFLSGSPWHVAMVVVVDVEVVFGVVGTVVARQSLHRTGHFALTTSWVRELLHALRVISSQDTGSSLPLQWVTFLNGAVCAGTLVATTDTAGAAVGVVVVAGVTGAAVLAAAMLVGSVAAAVVATVAVVVVRVVVSAKILNFGDSHSLRSMQLRPSPSQP